VADIVYRKTSDGTWVAYGPADQVAPGPIVVSKKDGSTKEEVVERVGRPFTVDGVAMVYGYLQPPPCANCDAPGGKHHRVDSSGIGGKVCDRCQYEPSYCLSFA
jgi:hypothetical protein